MPIRRRYGDRMKGDGIAIWRAALIAADNRLRLRLHLNVDTEHVLSTPIIAPQNVNIRHTF